MAERVWDKFLTDQDREHVAMGENKHVGFGEKPALLPEIIGHRCCLPI